MYRLNERKDIEFQVSLEQVNIILGMAAENEADVQEFIGVLNDNYIIDNRYGIDGKRIVIKRNGRPCKPRNYIIIEARYRNEWSDDLFCIMTDNSYTVDEKRKAWSEWNTEYEEEDSMA